LLDNAVKSTQNGTISLTVSRTSRRLPVSAAPADWINIAVQDTGAGIPIEQQARLFEVFTQADDFSTRNDNGSSLGLAISHRLAHMMGGYIDVVSAPGQGTTLTLRLPATVIARPPDPTVAVPMIALNPRSPVSSVLPSPAALPLSSPEPELVVVVDDSPTNRDRLVQALNQAGARAVATWCGSEGLRLARELRPSLITLDLSLPAQEAWSVLTALKTDPVLADIPVVMLSLSSQPVAIADSCSASDGVTGHKAAGNGVTENGVTGNGATGVTLGIVDYLTTPKDVRRLVNLAQRYLPSAVTGAVTGVATGSAVATEAVIWLVQDDSDMQPMLERALTRQHWHLIPWAELQPILEQALSLFPSPVSPSLVSSSLPLPSLTAPLPNLVVLDVALLSVANPLITMLGRLIVTRSLPVISIVSHELNPETTCALSQQVAGYLDQPDQQRVNVFTDLDYLIRCAINRSSCPSSP
ncbi:MAG TPA: ATP-binding protein, partial [Chroococcidiopsis sp.]